MLYEEICVILSIRQYYFGTNSMYKWQREIILKYTSGKSTSARKVLSNVNDGVIDTGTSPIGGTTILEGLSPSSSWLVHAVQIRVVCRVQRVESGRKGGAKDRKKKDEDTWADWSSGAKLMNSTKQNRTNNQECARRVVVTDSDFLSSWFANHFLPRHLPFS